MKHLTNSICNISITPQMVTVTHPNKIEHIKCNSSEKLRANLKLIFFFSILEKYQVKALVKRALYCIDFEWIRIKCLNCLIISIRFLFIRLAFLLNDFKSNVMSLLKEINITQAPMENTAIHNPTNKALTRQTYSRKMAIE